MSYVAPCCHVHFHTPIENDPIMVFCRPMILCKICGNKRCPKATNCGLECTGSNDVGQAGSVYGDRVIAESNLTDQRAGAPPAPSASDCSTAENLK